MNPTWYLMYAIPIDHTANIAYAITIVHCTVSDSLGRFVREILTVMPHLNALRLVGINDWNRSKLPPSVESKQCQKRWATDFHECQTK
jgi:hypothetical protein